VKGKIVLIPFPFTDLTAAKLRPAIVLFEGERDVVVAFISSRVPQRPTLTDIVVDEAHPEFEMTGLKTSSVIRLDKVATILFNEEEAIGMVLDEVRAAGYENVLVVDGYSVDGTAKIAETRGI